MKVATAAFFVVCWEVVQLAVHQILDLIILVRVQASQPKPFLGLPENRKQSQGGAKLLESYLPFG